MYISSISISILLACTTGCQDNNAIESKANLWLQHKYDAFRPFTGEQVIFREVAHGIVSNDEENKYLIWEGQYNSRDYDNFMTALIKPGKPWIVVNCIFLFPCIDLESINDSPIRINDVTVHGLIYAYNHGPFLVLNDSVTFWKSNENNLLTLEGNLSAREFKYVKTLKSSKWVLEKPNFFREDVWEPGYAKLSLVLPVKKSNK